ncbi:MAG: oxygen-independent coproporphyrinogen III oxidase [Bacteroidota bacterium]
MCDIIQKYNVPGPRYTSYPTVPYWDTASFSPKGWEDSVKKSFAETNASDGISLYIHLPFCESMCTFCGCYKRITKRHEVEAPYIQRVLKEWRLYSALFSGRPKIKELHLGGGTPTFFSPEHLKQLIHGIFESADRAQGHEFSFEGHPNNTTVAHLQCLYDLGFRRVSYGIQDYNKKVQRAIHREQPFENVKRVTEEARRIGYTSVGHDIIFGLPHQNLAHIEQTVLMTKALSPDRLAFYSYAHVPWIKGNGQRGYREGDLPSAEAKRRHYVRGKALLTHAGYVEIGMDHFAQTSDALYHAMRGGKLHRNFMGYTASKTQLMVGLGVSGIGDSWYGFAQNVKNLEEYACLVDNGVIPVFRGHLLTREDQVVRGHILNLMCRLETSWQEEAQQFQALTKVLDRLREMEMDGLLRIFPNSIKVTERGRAFVRNICMAFDLLLHKKAPETRLFSMTI